MLRSLRPGLSGLDARDTSLQVTGTQKAASADAGSTVDGAHEPSDLDASHAFIELISAQPGWETTSHPIATSYETWRSSRG